MKDDKIINTFSHCFGLSQQYSNGNIRYNNAINSNIIYITKIIKDITDDKINKYLNTYITTDTTTTSVDDNNKLYQISSLINNATVYSISPLNNITISLYNNKDNNIIEINYNTGGLYRLDVSDVHCNFASDSWFGGSSWSSDERYFIYVANIKKNNNKTYFKEYVKDDNNCKEGETVEFESTKYRYIDDWGEKLTGVEDLGLFLLDIVNKKVIQIPTTTNEPATVGQPCFINNNNENDGNSRNQYIVCYTTWKTFPRRLGIVTCYHRPCSIYATNITDILLDNNNNTAANHINLTAAMKTARSPRSSLDGKYLTFLGSKVGFETHNNSFGLYYITCSGIIRLLSDNSNNKNNSISNNNIVINTIVDTVYDPYTHLINGKLTTHHSAVNSSSNNTDNNSVIDVTNCFSMPFPGIYCDQLPNQCYHNYKNSTNIILQSQWGSSIVILSISLHTGDIKVVDVTNIITTEFNLQSVIRGSFTILDIQPCSNEPDTSQILLTFSTPSFPQVLLLVYIYEDNNIPIKYQIFQNNNKDTIQLIPNHKNTTLTTTNSNTTYYNTTLTNTITNDINWYIFEYTNDGITFETILLYPTTTTIPDKGLPLVVLPHGGPHSCTATTYLSTYSFLCSYLNCVVMHVNYRGSIGYGQNSINSLIGNISNNDVNDIIMAIQHVKTLTVTTTESGLSICSSSNTADNIKSLINGDQIAVVGGSHGGFLAGHLIGQYPNMFKAACLRNPVTNIPSMYGVADIPDWCIVESMGLNSYDFDHYNAPSEEQLLAMHRMSPIRHVNNVTTPTLICIGSKDRRVPPSQGMEYYHLLRSRGVTTKLMVFPEDSHPLDRPASEAEHWVAIAKWIQSYCIESSQ